MSNTRAAAMATIAARQPRTFARVVDGVRCDRLPELFGANTFSLARMEEKLPRSTFERLRACIDQGHRIGPDIAEDVALAAKEWAISRGATHFTHWFQPMTGSTAEKHDAFLAFNGGGRPVERFSGTMLIQSEPDASSFPSGGMRSTFEARGYTAWDPASPMFLMDNPCGRTLCVPSVFISYNGEPLDKKTPLLRSIDALSARAVRLLSLAGHEVGRVVPTLGCEQEYFLVDRALLALRPDLAIAGRTLLGARPPKGQSMEDHYFGSITPRVQAFMEEVEFELYKLGVPAKTRHNEVAPSQYELAAIFTEASLAVDQNQLVMEVLRRVAPRHDFQVLLHEKPYPGINGSGKHSNWSLQDDTGRNLLDPGDDPQANLRFLAVLASVLLGVHRHAALLRSSVAGHGNDFRLGANEAPPAVISVFLGDLLSRICEAVIEGRALPGNPAQAMIELGVSKLPLVARDSTDRNRTSPFAFTGNKFEFRAVGARQSPALPVTVLNAAVADGMEQVAAWAEEAGTGDDALLAALRRALVESRPSLFEGNNYDPAWLDEAGARGLPHLRGTPEAIARLRSEAAVRLFSHLEILDRADLESRAAIYAERYVTTVEVEVDLARELVDTVVMPAALAERSELAGALGRLLALEARGLDPGLAPERERFQRLGAAIEALRERRSVLESSVESARAQADDPARAWWREVVPALQELREAADAVEELVADERWPLPKIRELLFAI